jgi:hypothetical protein
MKSKNPSDKKPTESSRNDKYPTNTKQDTGKDGKTPDGKKIPDIPVNQVMGLVNGVLDIGSNVAGVYTERERTKQVALECQRDVAISNNEVEIERIRAQDRSSERLAKSEESHRAHEREMNEIERKNDLQKQYLSDRSELNAALREGQISIEQYQIQIASIEKGLD